MDVSSRRYSYKILENDFIGFDHPEIIMMALDRLRNKIEDTDIVFNLMPEYFTLGELQQIYEVILGKKLLIQHLEELLSQRLLRLRRRLRQAVIVLR